MTIIRFSLALLLASPSLVSAQPVETEVPGLTAELTELRQHEGVLRLAVRFVNTTAAPIPRGTGISFGEITLIDLKESKKHYGLKKPDGRFLAGPMSDAQNGGRWWMALPAKSEATLWLVFAPLPAGSVVSVQIPHMFPFEDVTIAEGPGTLFSSTAAQSTPSGLTAKLVSAVRTKTGDVRLRLRIERAAGAFEGPALEYRDTALFRPESRELFGLLQDANGLFVAQPLSDKGSGGRFWLNTIQPGKVVLMSLTFGGPPAPTDSVDLLLPWFLPITGIEIVEEGEPGKR